MWVLLYTIQAPTSKLTKMILEKKTLNTQFALGNFMCQYIITAQQKS